MHPILFTIGKITVYSYGVMMALGIISALLMGLYRGKKRGFNADTITDISFYGILGGIVGAKLLYLITEAEDILKRPGDILNMLTGGFVIYGAILGGIMSAFIYCRIKKIEFLKYLDLLVPSLALAQGIGRIGCLLAGCCYGKETSSSLGIIFKHSLYAPSDIKLYPTQIFSSIGDFLIVAILIFYSRQDRKEGRVAGLYMILYSIGRFFIEFLRGDPRGAVGIFSTSQFICLFILIGGIILVYKDKIKLYTSNN